MSSDKAEIPPGRIAPKERSERITILEKRRERLLAVAKKMAYENNADISSIVNDCKEIIEEVIDNSRFLLEDIEDSSNPELKKDPNVERLKLLLRIKEEFLTYPEEFNTRDGEFAELIRGLVPYLLTATNRDIKRLKRI